jgi:hypothetical protein
MGCIHKHQASQGQQRGEAQGNSGITVQQFNKEKFVYLKPVSNSQRPGPQYSGPFDMNGFSTREQRRTERLARAAYGVGHTHEWFVMLSREKQEATVQEWVEAALKARAIRLGHEADEWEFPVGFLEA